jgi:hypothetical protein
MRAAAHHRGLGDDVQVRFGGNSERTFWDHEWDRVYASAIFRASIPAAEHVRRVSPSCRIGGTGVDPARPGELVPLSSVVSSTVTNLGDCQITDGPLDYTDYPRYRHSIGFTQRGCRLGCEFCCVPGKEGKVREVATVPQIWRGDPWPRELHLLDNDFFGQPNWRARIAEMREGGFKVSFNQGINARFLTDEAAESLASVDYRDDSMLVRRLYTAWDNRKDEERLFAGLNRLARYGVKPDHIMVYMLIGFWPGETAADRDYRRRRLREFGARPYPMPYVRTTELVGFQRWVIGAYDKRICWEDWRAAGYRPERLGHSEPLLEN